MPRTTASLVTGFGTRIAEALDLATAAEAAANFTYTRRLHVYEAGYLLVFSAWENFLEQSLLRFLCGYRNTAGLYGRVGSIPYFRSINAAHHHLLRGRTYLLWHNPQDAVNRSNANLNGGPHASVLLSALADIRNYSYIRNHVAHRSADTGNKFELATLAFTGRRIAARRAGRFLRLPTTLPHSGAISNWLGRICVDLENYARQIAG